MKKKILIVEDKPVQIKLLRTNLEASGFEVLIAERGRQAIDIVVEKAPDLVLLDLILPDMDGFGVCSYVRKFSQVPIIMVTAHRVRQTNKVRGLDAGADDYITKPFGIEELLARIRAALRRPELTGSNQRSVCSAGDLQVDFARKQVVIREKKIKLAPIEYKLLCELIRNKGRVMEHNLLLKRVWEPGYEGETKILHKAIHRLRKKLGDDSQHPRYIHSRPGIGYVLIPPDAGSS